MLEMMLLELICSQIKAAQSWGAAGMLLLYPALVTLRGTPWGQLTAAALPAPELETFTVSLVQPPGRGSDPPQHLLAVVAAGATSQHSSQGRKGQRDVGKDTRTLTCRSDLHRAGAHLRQPLQADAVLHRPGG